MYRERNYTVKLRKRGGGSLWWSLCCKIDLFMETELKKKNCNLTKMANVEGGGVPESNFGLDSVGGRSHCINNKP